MNFRAIAVILSLVPHAAQASEYRDWRKIGQWTITRNVEEQACQLSSIYEGDGSTMVIVTYIPGTDTARLGVGNKGWTSLKKGDDPKISISFGVEGDWSDVSTTSFVTDEYHWLTMSFDGLAFLKDVASASSMRLTRGDVVVDKLSLTGSRAAVAATIECATGINKGIARDPFM